MGHGQHGEHGLANVLQGDALMRTFIHSSTRASTLQHIRQSVFSLLSVSINVCQFLCRSPPLPHADSYNSIGQFGFLSKSRMDQAGD
jgi:hypothetical protein